ncbi:hypothetical protein C0Z19_27300, partial [Trinickia soli]
PTSWSPNSTRTNKEIYNQHRATPNPAESVTFPKSAVTFAEIRRSPTFAATTAQPFATYAGVSSNCVAD